jgi:hypothetical protein
MKKFIDKRDGETKAVNTTKTATEMVTGQETTETILNEPKEDGRGRIQVRDAMELYRASTIRIDKHEDLIKAIYRKMEYLELAMKRVEDLATGKDVNFEEALRKETVNKVLVTEEMRDLYGDEAPADIQTIVSNVLGRDVVCFMKPNRAIPSSLFTVLVPKRLSGNENDFRSCTIYNASAESDVKKWCERVKSNLFKTFASQSKGVPMFLVQGKE